MAFIDETTNDLRMLIEADFGKLPSATRIWEDALYDWLNYRARLIPTHPRQVVISDQAKGCLSAYPAISAIAAALRVGSDISPWLSNRVRRRKEDPKADLMFNDWQISHFHLGLIFDKPQQVKRSGSLLFAYINTGRAVLLDVQPHGSWSMQDLLRILLRTSPTDMDTELIGVEPEPPISDEELFALRKKGVNVALNIDGRAFMPPGLALVSSGAAIRIVRFGDGLRAMFAGVRQRLADNSLTPEFNSYIAQRIGLPVRLGLRFSGSVFYAYDKNRNLNLFQSRPLT